MPGRVQSVLKRSASVVAPTGWSEIHVGVDTVDRVVAPRTIFLYYVVGLAVFPVVLAVFFTYHSRGGSLFDQRVLSLVLGYNALLVVSYLTAATVSCVLILVFMRYAGILLIKLDVVSAFRTVAAWTGYGTAAGVVTAAMLPVVNGILPFSASPNSATDSMDIINPQLLVDLPAAGAVAGYGIGLIVSAVVVCGTAENLLVGRLFAPTLFVMVLSTLASLGLDPRGLFTVLSSRPEGSAPGQRIDCSSSVIQSTFLEHPTDTSWLVRVLNECGTPFILGGWTFVAFISISVVLLAGIWAAVDFRRRFMNGQKSHSSKVLDR
jgi:hypothetical protein